VSERRHGERGSVLLLMPASVLVLLVLGALAVDAALLLLGEREAADLSAAAANDAAVAGIDRDALYHCGTLTLDASQANLAVQRVVLARSSDAMNDVSAAITGVEVVDGLPRVTVTTTGTVDLIFTPAIPGFDLTRQVRATASAFPQVAGPDPAGLAAGDCS
jgi:hypothetical protein